MDEEKIKAAIREACRNAGGQVAFAKEKGLGQGWVSDYLSGRKKIRNMTLATLYKFFPDLEMVFFKPESNNVDLLSNLEKRVAELEKAQNMKREIREDFSRRSNGAVFSIK